MVQRFFDNMNIIDVHDHHRQGSLAMESSWKTKTGYSRHRLFTTVLAMAFTDCYVAYKYHMKVNNLGENKTYRNFLGNLANQLVFNRCYNVMPQLRNRPQ